MTTFSDLLQHLGGMPVLSGIPFGVNANYYFVDPANGNDNNPGTFKYPFASLTTAEDACTANQHDVVFYIAGASSISLSATLTWDKSYTHLVGICAPSSVGQRARIFQTATATGVSPLLNITASGCVFKNFYIFHGVNDATSLINVQVTGQRNYFENVHFAGGGHDTMAIDNCASLFVNGGAENRFVGCVFGVDTIALGNGGNVLRFDGSATRNRFERCLIQTLIDNAGARLLEVVDATGLDRWTIFDDCLFLSNSVNNATTMASAFEIPAGHTVTAKILLRGNTSGLGFTDWDDDDRGIVYLQSGTITAGGNSGIMQVSNKT